MPFLSWQPPYLTLPILPSSLITFRLYYPCLPIPGHLDRSEVVRAPGLKPEDSGFELGACRTALVTGTIAPNEVVILYGAMGLGSV